MIKEKHTLTNPYNHHALSRYIDVYEVSTNGCHSVPESGYKGTEATLVDEPAWNEKFSSYSITGATLTGNNFIINNDVTAQANYETAKNLTLQTDGPGSIASNKMSGFIGDQATLSNTPSAGYEFSGYSITGATLTGSKFNFVDNDVTAKALFVAGPTAYNGIWYLTSYYDPRSAKPSRTLDALMVDTMQFVTPIGNMSTGVTRDCHILMSSTMFGTGTTIDRAIPKSIVVGNNHRISGSITAHIRRKERDYISVSLGIDPNYTTYYTGTAQNMLGQWTSASILSMQQYQGAWAGQSAWKSETAVFNVDASNIPGTLFLATSAAPGHADSERKAYIESVTANLIETRD